MTLNTACTSIPRYEVHAARFGRMGYQVILVTSRRWSAVQRAEAIVHDTHSWPTIQECYVYDCNASSIIARFVRPS